MKNLKIFGIIALLTIIGSINVYAMNSGVYVEQNTGKVMTIHPGSGIRSGSTWGRVSVTALGEETTGTWTLSSDRRSVRISFDRGFLNGTSATYQVSLNRLTGNGETWIRR